MTIRSPLSVSRPSHCRGNTLIEFALVLPILLLLIFGVVDYGRAIQFANILTGISGESANLAARTPALPDFIISATSSTASPLKITTQGMIYITVLVGRSDGRGIVVSQNRMAGGDPSQASRVYVCPAWSGTGCVVPGNSVAVALPMTLSPGEIVHVAEASFNYTPLAGYISSAVIPLYSISLL